VCWRRLCEQRARDGKSKRRVESVMHLLLGQQHYCRCTRVRLLFHSSRLSAVECGCRCRGDVGVGWRGGQARVLYRQERPRAPHHSSSPSTHVKRAKLGVDRSREQRRSQWKGEEVGMHQLGLAREAVDVFGACMTTRHKSIRGNAVHKQLQNEVADEAVRSGDPRANLVASILYTEGLHGCSISRSRIGRLCLRVDEYPSVYEGL
jgi:hypothetical protein